MNIKNYKINDIVIKTNRFTLRELNAEDVTEKYLNWLNDKDITKWIVAASKKNNLNSLKEYVSQRIGRNDILFLAIFDNKTNSHIGNIKYEPIDYEAGIATMGILIGEREYRGKGVFAEVFLASASWLKNDKKISRINLGVEMKNHAAIRAYQKCGFKINNGENGKFKARSMMMSYDI